jgi:hypothetical protein
MLESVGAYAYAASHSQAGTTNAQAQADSVPLEIDGVCCYNFQGTPSQGTIPEFPLPAVALLAAGGALVVERARRRRQKRTALTN